MLKKPINAEKGASPFHAAAIWCCQENAEAPFPANTGKITAKA
jgi:hypothetical protein